MRSRRWWSPPLTLLLFSSLVSAGSAEEPGENGARLQTLRELLGRREFKEVIERGRALMTELDAAGGADPARGAEILDLVVEATWRGGEAADPGARDLAQQAIKLKQAAYGDGHPEVAASYGNLGVLLMRAGDYAPARDALERALAIRERALGPDHLDVSNSIDALASLLQGQGHLEEALPLYQRSLAIVEQSGGAAGDRLARVLQNLGNLLLRMGRHGEARATYERALRIKERILEPGDPSIAMTLISMGVLFQQTGDLQAAREHLERGLKISETSLGPEHPLASMARNNLANVLYTAGEFEAAQPLYRRAVVLSEDKLGPDHPRLADFLHNLGANTRSLGDLDGALPLYQRALSIYEKSLGPDHPVLGELLNSLGHLKTLQGDRRAARADYERALRVRLQALGPDHPDTAVSRYSLSGLLLAVGERGEALRQADLASETLDRHLRETVAFMPEREAMLMVAGRRRPESVLFKGLLSGTGDRHAWLAACWRWTLRRRGLVQEELARRSRSTLTESEPRARSAWEDLAEARKAIGELWVKGPGEDAAAFQAALVNARSRKEDLEIRLAALSPRFREERSLAGIGLADLRHALPPSSALVEIVRVEVGLPTDENRPEHDLALIIGADGRRSFVDLGPADETDRLVSRWRRSLAESMGFISDGESDAVLLDGVNESGGRLREALLEPVLHRLEGAGKIFFVPDGAFHEVDMAALPSSGDRFLIEEGPAFHLLDSARDLVRLRVPSRDEGRRSMGILALGDPDFDASGGLALPPSGSAAGAFRGAASECAALAEMEWPPLPESRREILMIQSIFRGKEKVSVLTGRDASEARFKAEAPGKRILHLSTHGFFLQGACREKVRAANPLLLSGLALAGAGRSGETEAPGSPEDGILTAEELAAMDLLGVDLAVLSACDTARGVVAAGEGVFGLRRSFALAGARTVLMSLWPVPDRQARRWMTTFYSGRHKGASIIEAVREASLRSLAELRELGRAPHPYLWAGFVASGDWR